MLDWSDIVLRLGVATVASAAIGLNRDLHDKPIGVRTLGIVGLATSLVVLTSNPIALEAGLMSDATSRVVQGILTGIGFLGAGVIIHSERGKVRGLTSAACVWLTACIGVMCGLGHWRLVVVAMGLTLALLVFGGVLERTMHRLIGGKGADDDLPRD